ncbi:hypothetical protein [Mesorhizobium sp. CAU 1732]|uniref:hypothetical protein n=1 Tax=Mesorhizobium sp. CAU 1732 TaxID=3140358 RepID=UPI0032604326
MDWKAAIETNRQALKRVLVGLVAMAGIIGGGADRTATLPRHLHRAVLRLLRPAEAAARRLVIVAARGLVVTLPPARLRKPKVLAGPQTGQASPRKAGHGFQLFDPLPRSRRPRRSSRSGVPRICFPGLREPFPVPRPPSADDLLDAGRLTLRLTALASALDDLPRQARRFARWRVTRDAAATQSMGHEPAGAKNISRQPGRIRRVWPLRPGRPPGARSRPTHEVHDILETVHGLAAWAMERHDTS